MEETYHGKWHGTEETLRRDGFGLRFDVTVAVDSDAMIGFAAWRPTYDLHYCVAGLEVIDMFVLPPYRGRGIAPCLLARVAADGAGKGATYMTGGAVETGSARRLYRRSTVTHGGQPYLSGKAFRALAELEGASPRQFVAQLPPEEWNFQP